MIKGSLPDLTVTAAVVGIRRATGPSFPAAAKPRVTTARFARTASSSCFVHALTSSSSW